MEEELEFFARFKILRPVMADKEEDIAPGRTVIGTKHRNDEAANLF
jgi:hypothetical protein